MAWLEAHQELRDHPKTKRAARILGISRPQMIGHMLCLWWWCLDYAQDGDLSDFDNADIADAAEWDGEPEAFVKALLTCGPADRAGFLVDHNGLRVNDWEEYGGRYIVKRNQSRDRQRTYRQRNTDEKPHNALVTRDSGVSSNAREDKIREDKIREDERMERAPQAPATSPTYPPGFTDFERNFVVNLINAIQERQPGQRFQSGLGLSDTSRAALLQVMNGGPLLSAKAIDWALDQWEQAKPSERFDATKTGCVNWMLATINNSYKPGQQKERTNGKSTSSGLGFAGHAADAPRKPTAAEIEEWERWEDELAAKQAATA